MSEIYFEIDKGYYIFIFKYSPLKEGNAKGSA